MKEKNRNWKKGAVHSSVTPQGLTKDESNKQPKSQLEQRAQKKSTKI